MLQYIHETLRDEDHTIPSSGRIFDANSFAGLSARHGNEFERRFYTELCSSSMFTQFVCDRVVFGVRALFDRHVARKSYVWVYNIVPDWKDMFRVGWVFCTWCSSLEFEKVNLSNVFQSINIFIIISLKLQECLQILITTRS